MICVINCYGQRAHAQQLARVGQTTGVGMAGMTLGEVACDGLHELRSGLHEARARARGRCL